MAQCVCGATHGCSCQLRIASDGSQRCSTCLVAYELTLNKGAMPAQSIPQDVTIHRGIHIQNITYTHNHGT
jgi:hypothetical protein